MAQDNKGIYVAIIMDGNRRFAKRLMLEPWKGHEYGEEKLEEVLEWCKEEGISMLTVYAFSMQNFNRPKHEFDYLMKLFLKGLNKLEAQAKRVEDEHMKIRFLGRIDLFPQEIQDAIKQVETLTKNNDTFTLNFCFGYGGREEIVDATYRLATDIKKGKIQPEQIDEEIIDTYMYSKDKPDLIIRTGGDIRTSNFLNWQAAYSEWYFYEKTWPEFSKEDFKTILKEFKQRERRFGK